MKQKKTLVTNGTIVFEYDWVNNTIDTIKEDLYLIRLAFGSLENFVKSGNEFYRKAGLFYEV